nr:MAG TPA: hypothetical protein [Caudoviricetes sp.]
MNGKLLKIRGVWVRDPDPDSWSPVHYPEWTAGSGRTASGCSVGAIKHRKWKLPLSWTNIPEAEAYRGWRKLFRGRVLPPLRVHRDNGICRRVRAKRHSAHRQRDLLQKVHGQPCGTVGGGKCTK